MKVTLKRDRGKRSRGSAGKTRVFGLLKRNWKVLGRIAPNRSRKEVMSIIQEKIFEDSILSPVFIICGSHNSPLACRNLSFPCSYIILSQLYY